MAIIMIIAMSDGDEAFIPRCLDLERLLARRSVFLFGPRQTGKSTYVQRQLADTVALSFSLLDQGLLTSVLADPTRIRKEIEARDLRDTVICIDEIQKCPPLMDEVHLMIEERGIRFLLTGSSARALTKAQGRQHARRARERPGVHPFSWFELGERFSLERALNHGPLPPHYLSDWSSSWTRCGTMDCDFAEGGPGGRRILATEGRPTSAGPRTSRALHVSPVEPPTSS